MKFRSWKNTKMDQYIYIDKRVIKISQNDKDKKYTGQSRFSYWKFISDNQG